MSRVLNVNVGILGHVDSGKTTLAKALSSVGSTASFDKNPQSQQRGITLDLGFSSFSLDLNAPNACEKLRSAVPLQYDTLQFTLVDCPGHASLIRTVLGGAQIIDFMMLVVDAKAGIQTQTAECLVIGEVLASKLVVIVNKIDLLGARREAEIEKVVNKLWKTFERTKFDRSAAVMVPVSAAEAGNNGSDDPYMKNLIAAMTANVIDMLGNSQSALYGRVHADQSAQAPTDPLLMAVDHCFPVRGQGTVMTGTVLRGCVKVGDVVQIVELATEKKVKSMQMFRQSVNVAHRGDRVGVCVTQFDASQMERGLLASPGAVVPIRNAVVLVQKVRFYKGSVHTGQKFHVTVGGHSTVMATLTLFGDPFSLSSLTQSSERLPDVRLHDGMFDRSSGYLYREDLDAVDHPEAHGENTVQFGLLEFQSRLHIPIDTVFLGSKLDADINKPMCRIAFHGRFLVNIGDDISQLRIYKVKQRSGVVDRVVDDNVVIARDFFDKNADISAFMGFSVRGPNGERGVLESTFGKSGKYKVRFEEACTAQLKGQSLSMEFKKFIFDQDKKRVAQ